MDYDNEPLITNRCDNNDELYSSNNNNNSKLKDYFKSMQFKVLLYHSWFVILSLIYLAISVGLPFFNKTLFKYYNFPLTSSFFQTLGSAFILLIFNIIQYTQQKHDLILKSYFFDKNFMYKSLIMLPVSICFAGVMILTNLGIQSAPINYHIVFKSTNIIWVVIFSILINKERPSIYEFLSIALLMFGAIMVSLDFVKTNSDSGALPIVFNLLSSFFESVTIVLLKWACTYLYRNDDTITVIEISFFKVAQATLVIMIPMLIVEKFHGFKVFHSELDTSLIILSGVGITIVYQTAMVWLSKSLYSTTVGIISQLQIIPQILISAYIYNSFAGTKLHLAGLIMCVSGCIIFSIYHFLKVNPKYIHALKNRIKKIKQKVLPNSNLNINYDEQTLINNSDDQQQYLNH
ncbi:hypothetical protein DLAC_05887 [Tieghemostelium lacteum]|uniref:Sugar phosphate transporter domain-containing protein n=1 Tax=Tieghemostelium lacteum TaxID=361077 RepID=A0A151ZH53_TIELA|nr:hypothetical protein DLAC_05887 [Tieghemostelium lacteum]|eukprot:KYQ93239.1 hypothetical protein DLAC_05887 [Tieghemostelium lacteum]